MKRESHTIRSVPPRLFAAQRHLPLVDRSTALDALDLAAPPIDGFRRLKGHKDMPKLVATLRARDRQLGIAVSVENVAWNVTRAAAEFSTADGTPPDNADAL